MDYKQELLGTTFRKAKGIKEAISNHGITPKMTEKKIEALVIKLADAKVTLLGGKRLDYLSGQEWYVNNLIKLSSLDKTELMTSCYDELNVENSSFDELTAML